MSKASGQKQPGGKAKGQKEYNANEVIFDNWNVKEKKYEAAAKSGEAATEPPYSDAELDRILEVAQTLYSPLGAHARGTKIHNGPLELRDAKKPPYRVGWIHRDKQFDPYITFSKEQPRVPTSAGPPKLWLPRELREAKKKGVKNSGPKHEYKEEEIKTSHKKLVERPRWDTEHHIMVSQANPEVQKFVREYFDKPIRKESEGVPKVRELYTMNDRQAGWWDEASPLGQSKHTDLDNVQPWSVGGPKVGQLPSYWRRIAEKGSVTEPTPDEKLTLAEGRSHLRLTERLADMPAAQSTQFWREWVHLSKKRLPPAPEPRRRDKKRGGSPTKTGKRGGWPIPPESPRDAEPAAGITPLAPSNSAPALLDKEPAAWNERWNVTCSKDNEYNCRAHKQLFSSAQFLSGAEDGHPGAMLGLTSQKWRNVAKNVSRSPSGVAGRGSCGRRCLLV